jgi:galactokinase
MARLSFPERAERALIVALLLAIVMVAQRYSIQIYRYGLLLLVGATLLQIAVGNLPKDAGLGRSLALIVAILCAVAAVFGTGVLLTPFLSQLGR